MPSKQRLDQLKSVKAIAVQVCKKRKSEASLVFNIHLKVKDDKLSTTGISNTEGKSGTCFWNKSGNESDSDNEKKEDKDKKEEDKDKEEKDNNQKEKNSGIQKAVSLNIPKMDIKRIDKEKTSFKGDTKMDQGQR